MNFKVCNLSWIFSSRRRKLVHVQMTTKAIMTATSKEKIYSVQFITSSSDGIFVPVRVQCCCVHACVPDGGQRPPVWPVGRKNRSVSRLVRFLRGEGWGIHKYRHFSFFSSAQQFFVSGKACEKRGTGYCFVNDKEVIKRTLFMNQFVPSDVVVQWRCPFFGKVCGTETGPGR